MMDMLAPAIIALLLVAIVGVLAWTLDMLRRTA